MKINAIINYSNNFPYKQNKVHANPIVFGHYLDYEKSDKQSRLSSLDSQISDVNSRIWSDEYDFDRASSSLNSEIESAERELYESENKVTKLEHRVDSRQSYIEDLESEGYRLQNQIKNNNKTIKKLEKEKQDKMFQIKQSNDELQKKLAEEFKTNSENLKSQHNDATRVATDGIKNNLIQKVINPILKSTEDKECNIPSSIYIENDLGVPEPFFQWLVKQTDSNYAKLDISKLSDEKQATSLLKKISILASRSFEETGRRTFTLLEGLEASISPILNGEALKNLLTNSEKLYHNIIVFVSKLPSIDIMKNNKFDIDVKVEKSFLTDKKLGHSSLSEFVLKHKCIGEDLMSKIIRK